MKVDNRLRTAKLKIAYMLTFIVILALSMYFYFEYHYITTYPISFGILLPGAMIILSIIYVTFLLRKLDYFFVEYLGNKIMVRYYTAYPIFRKYKAFEIPRSYFHDYEIKSSLLGFLKSVQFTVKTPKGKFKYPPLSITLLSKRQLDDLFNMLDELKLG